MKGQGVQSARETGARVITDLPSGAVCHRVNEKVPKEQFTAKGLSPITSTRRESEEEEELEREEFVKEEEEHRKDRRRAEKPPEPNYPPSHTKKKKKKGKGAKRRRGGTRHQKHYREREDPFRRSHRRLDQERLDFADNLQAGLERRA